MMGNDRVFELFRKGRFNVMCQGRKYNIRQLYWDTTERLILLTSCHKHIPADICNEIVPWVDKYRDVIDKVYDEWIYTEDGYTKNAMKKIVSEIETLHNKEQNDGKR